jgi:putative ABC transport system permease protein
MFINRAGALLIAVQTAITVAMLCNGLFILQQRLTLSKRASGTAETNLFVISNRVVGDAPNLSERLRTDVTLLRSLPGVVDAYATNAYPLGNSGWTDSVTANHDQLVHETTPSAIYLADEHTIDTLGIKLVAGRNFNVGEVSDQEAWNKSPPLGIIVTSALAKTLFPTGDALGKTVFLRTEKQLAPIIGIVERLQAPWTSVIGDRFVDNSILEPFRFISPTSFYIVRARQAPLAGIMQESVDRLMKADPTRIIEKVQSLSVARAEAYREDRGLAILLAAICATLLGATTCGIAGATRVVIVSYFQTEILLFVAIGSVAGMAFAIALNSWMVAHFQMAHLQYSYAVVSCVIVLLLGQLAALWPAMRAARVSSTARASALLRTSWQAP